jgi:arylsulfatase A-like enzyme
LPPGIVRSLEQLGLGTKAPGRDNNAPGTQKDNSNIGNWEKAGTLVANESQQKYFLDAVTKVLLPKYAEQSQPFIIVFWSRDPDGTQHSHGDSLGTITPGINGPTSMAAVKNADSNLRTLRDAINADPRLAANTDIIVTSDHGFSTISRRDLDGSGKSFTASYAAQQHYKDPVTGKELQPKGFLPHGFLAIDLAHGLNLTHYDPDCVSIAKNGHGLIGGSGVLGPITDAEIIVASNGGSDLIYVPGKDVNLMTRIVKLLAKQDYVSGLFVDDSFGKIPGTLPMSAINLRGTGLLPMPSLVVNFRTFATDPAKPFVTQVVLADTSLTQGQGMHGSFGRGDTLNAMLAFGPDFKNGFIDPAPSSNADLAITIAHILGLELPSKGVLRGRVLSESLRGQPMVEFTTGSMRSEVDESSGQVTILKFQDAGGVRYFDTAGFMGRTNGLDN